MFMKEKQEADDRPVFQYNAIQQWLGMRHSLQVVVKSLEPGILYTFPFKVTPNFAVTSN